MKKQNKLIKIITCCIILFSYIYFIFKPTKTDTIKVGILHSRTGPLAFNETPLIDMTLFTINEINNHGGILGKKIEPILVDGQSNPEIFAKEAEMLILEKKVEVIFGCWSSASRKAVKKVVEKYDKLLFYPTEYAGLEESKNIIYMNLTINKQVIASIAWAIKNLGKKIFLIGSDYSSPRGINEFIKEFAPHIEGTIVGEEYIPLKSEKFEKAIDKIEQTKPDFILNNISGSGNIILFKKLNNLVKKGIKTNIISLSLSENEFELLDINNISNLYICASYFQAIHTKKNKAFARKFKTKFGINKILSDAMVSAYYAVNLWALSVKSAKTLETKKIRSAIEKVIYNGPGGIYQVAKNGNVWSPIFIGQSDKKTKLKIVWESGISIAPIAFPSDLFISKFIKDSKSKIDWDLYMNNLYKKWGNKWEAS